MANTGYKGWATLEQYYTDDNTSTGVTKANTEGQPDYVEPVPDTSACSVGYVNTPQTGSVPPPTGLSGQIVMKSVEAGIVSSQNSQAEADQIAYNIALDYARQQASFGFVYLGYRFNNIADACSNVSGTFVTIYGTDTLLGNRIYEVADNGQYYEVLTDVNHHYNLDGSIRKYEYDAGYGYNVMSAPLSCGGGGGGGGTGNYVGVIWAGFSMSEWDICSIAGSGQNSVATYISNFDGLHYADTALTTLAQEGYYARYGDSALYEYVYIVGGSEVSGFTTCPA